MQLYAVEGLNKKKFIEVHKETKEDLKLMEHIESIVSRKEYLPFSKGFSKWKHQSYLIKNTHIPFTFWQDIKKRLQPVMEKKLEIVNDWLYYNNDITREFFDEYMESLILPEKYDIFKEEYAYQMECVFRALVFKTARIEIGTGGGKTLITYLYVRYMIDNILPRDKKILIVVPRQLLAKQTQAEFKEYDQFADKPLNVETIYSGSKRIADANVVIGVYNSLANYDSDYFDDFGCMICDEVQGAKAWSIRNEIYAKCFDIDYFFGMTGTYPDYNTLDYLNIVAMFGPLVYVKKTHELIDDGNVSKVQINKIKINYPQDSDFSQNLINSGFVGIEKFRIEKKFFQNFEPRNRIMAKLINKFEYNHLILVESVQYCKDLQEFFRQECPDRHVVIIHGNVKNRDEIIADMKTRHDVILIATYETMSTGVSINNIMHVHFPDGGRSEIRIKQSIGRGLRLHLLKELLNVWDYQDNMPRSSFKNHAAARNIIYANEKLPVVMYETAIISNAA
jgi:superfamily II DNA or RNA helicase